MCSCSDPGKQKVSLCKLKTYKYKKHASIGYYFFHNTTQTSLAIADIPKHFCTLVTMLKCFLFADQKSLEYLYVFQEIVWHEDALQRKKGGDWAKNVERSNLFKTRIHVFPSVARCE